MSAVINAREKTAGSSHVWSTVGAAARRQGLLVLVVALGVFLSVASPFFLTWGNLLTMLSIASVLGIMALAQTFLIVSGGLDISVGSVIAVVGMGTVLLTNAGWSVWLAAALMLIVGAAIGAFNGWLVIFLKINSLIVTLGTMSIFSGLAYMLGTGAAFDVPQSSFTFLGTGRMLGVPVVVWVFIVGFVALAFIERRTKVGREIYMIGGNRDAARLAGIRVRPLSWVLYVVSGASAAVAGIFLTAQLGAAAPSIGNTYTLSVVTAVILGGASLAGGRGSVFGTVVAALFLGLMQNGFTLMLISSYAQTFILGVALIIAVFLDQLGRREHDG